MSINQTAFKQCICPVTNSKAGFINILYLKRIFIRHRWSTQFYIILTFINENRLVLYVI